MITQINTINDVKSFAKHLVQVEKLSFHPDDAFDDYIKFENNEPFYTTEEAMLRNSLMDDSFRVCDDNNVEIYEILLPIINQSVNV